MYCNRSCLWVCDSGRAVSEPYYGQRTRSVCISERFFISFVPDFQGRLNMGQFEND